MAYQDLYNQMANAAPAPNPYAMVLRNQPMMIPRPPRPQKQGGGNNMASIASKIARKYFDGPTTSSGAGSAETFALGEQTGQIAGAPLSSGMTTLGGANAGVGGGISGASVTGGTAGAGLGGGSVGGGISGASVTGGPAGAGLGGGSVSSGLAAMAPAAGVLAMPFVARELLGGGNPNIAKALRDFKTGQDEKGPRGLSLTEAGGVTFLKGDEGEINRAWRQAMDHGITVHQVRPDLISLEAKADDVKPIISSNSPGMDNSLFGYLSNG